MERFALEALRNAASLSLPFAEAARMALAPLAADDLAPSAPDDLAPSAAAATDDDGSSAVDEAVKTWLWLDARLGSHLAGNHVAARGSAAMGAALLRAVVVGHMAPNIPTLSPHIYLPLLIPPPSSPPFCARRYKPAESRS